MVMAEKALTGRYSRRFALDDVRVGTDVGIMEATHQEIPRISYPLLQLRKCSDIMRLPEVNPDTLPIGDALRRENLASNTGNDHVEYR